MRQAAMYSPLRQGDNGDTEARSWPKLHYDADARQRQHVEPSRLAIPEHANPQVVPREQEADFHIASSSIGPPLSPWRKAP